MHPINEIINLTQHERRKNNLNILDRQKYTPDKQMKGFKKLLIILLTQINRFFKKLKIFVIL